MTPQQGGKKRAAKTGAGSGKPRKATKPGGGYREEFSVDLADAYDKYFSLFKDAPVPCLLLGRDGIIREANDAAIIQLAPRGNKLTGRPFLLFAARDSHPIFYEHLRQVFETKELQTVEIALEPDSARTVLLISRPVAWVSGDAEPVCSMAIIDITPLKQQSRSAENDRVLAWSIIYTIPEPLIILDKDLNIVFANPVFYFFSRTTPNLTEGKPFFEIQEGVWNAPGFRDLLLRVIPEHLRFDHFDMECTIPELGEKSLTISGCRMDQEGGGVPQILLTVHDVTSNKQRAALEERARDLDSFNYSISHDLRTPLQVIESFTYLLLEEEYRKKIGKEGSWIVETIRDSGRKMRDIVEGLLNLSRLSRVEPGFTDIDMAALAREVFREATMLLEGRDIALRIADEEMPHAVGDSILIRQVLVNLIGNAVKFTRARAKAVIEIGGRTEGTEAIYYVNDNGIGFARDEAQKLFSVFQRLPAHKKIEGSGIGLAIVKTIIGKHSGRVYAEAEPDKGATFYFTLPWKP